MFDSLNLLGTWSFWYFVGWAVFFLEISFVLCYKFIIQHQGDYWCLGPKSWSSEYRPFRSRFSESWRGHVNLEFFSRVKIHDNNRSSFFLFFLKCEDIIAKVLTPCTVLNVFINSMLESKYCFSQNIQHFKIILNHG